MSGPRKGKQGVKRFQTRQAPTTRHQSYLRYKLVEGELESSLKDIMGRFIKHKNSALLELWRIIKLVPVEYNGRSLKLGVELPDSIPKEIAEVVIKKTFKNDEYVKFLLEGKNGIAFEELKEFPEFSEDLLIDSEYTEDEGIPLEVMALNVDMEYRIPILNAIELTKKAGRTEGYWSVRALKAMSDYKKRFMIPTEYVIKGYKKAIDGEVDYSRIKNIIRAWNSAVSEYRSAVSGKSFGISWDSIEI